MWKNDQEKFFTRLLEVTVRCTTASATDSVVYGCLLGIHTYSNDLNKRAITQAYEIELTEALFDIQFHRINIIKTRAIFNNVGYLDGYYKWRTQYFLGQPSFSSNRICNASYMFSLSRKGCTV